MVYGSDKLNLKLGKIYFVLRTRSSAFVRFFLFRSRITHLYFRSVFFILFYLFIALFINIFIMESLSEAEIAQNHLSYYEKLFREVSVIDDM